MSELRAYAWKPRTSFAIDVQKAGQELDRLKGHNSGDLTPEAVIEAAKDGKNPLHGAFEWDDSKAAHQHRLQTAGLLIKSIVVTITKADDGKPEPLSVTVTQQKSGGTTTAAVISPEELHARRVQRGWSDLEDWRKQYGELPEFSGIAAALSGFLAMRAAEKKKSAA